MARSFVATLALCCSMLGLLTTATAQEAPAARSIVPAALQPWVGWALYDEPDIGCPYADDERLCEWPGDLSITVTDDGARFEMRVFLDRDLAVRLPGSNELWPQSVRNEAGPVVIVSSETALPFARLSRGSHVIRGEFEWSETPEVIDVPPLVGKIRVRVGGQAVPFPRVRDNQLFLGDAASEEGEADSLRVSVYRQFQDGVPLRVITRLELTVSGKAREVDLGLIQLAKSVPVGITSELPTRAPRDGAVNVYVRPGTHFVDITSIVAETVSELTVPKVEQAFYEPQEVWVWRPDETTRAVQTSGLTGVDPERTTLPAEWRGDTTFLAEPGQTMTITETRRGMPERAPNMVNLSRELWLDLDGTGYTVRDRLTGQVNQGWRLNHGPGASLGRASQNGQDLFITDDPETKLSGVEIRASQLDLQAELRLDNTLNDIGIVGWDHDVQSLQATLRLPPGWTLMGGQGVDRMPGTWLDSWTLWDFFFVLMVALAIGKLFGWGWVPVSVIALCLAHGHGEAPEMLWIHLIASLALLRVVPQGIWRKAIVIYRWGAIAVLVVVLSMYARQQIREAMHPQVGDANITFQDKSVMNQVEFGGEPQSEPPMEMAKQEMEDQFEEKEMNLPSSVMSKSDRAPQRSKKGGSWGRKGYSDYGNLQQIDPNSVVQTGPGLPTWAWTTWQLHWSGPVRKDHRISLFLIPPNINMLITFVRVALLILLALLLLAPAEMYWNRRSKNYGMWTKIFGQASAVFLAIGLVGQADAEEPPPQIQAQANIAMAAPSDVDEGVLQQLRSRLVAETTCDTCVIASRADVQLKGRAWSLTAEVHVEKLSSWSLPGTADSLEITAILIDGVPTSKIRRSPQGLTQIRLQPGRHIISVRGKLPNRNVVTIQLDADHPPRLVTFDSDDWSVDGISPKGVPDASLQLTRKAQSDTQAEQELVSELPPWFFVERTFQLGLPWQIRTRISREDLSRPQLAKLPLLEGEKVISASTRVKENHALVDFDRGIAVVEYVSEIPIKELIELKASADKPWSETWTVECSRIWQCDFEGIPAIQDVRAGQYGPTWKPWPGETLAVNVKRPEGTPGQVSTVDSVAYTMTPGRRLMQAELEMTVRASQGTRQDVKLPANAELQKVTIDGVEKPIRPSDGVVSLPVEPRTQTFRLTWQQPWERQTIEQLPQIDIGSPAVNTTLKINLGEERWLVWAQGPAWGPAILFWSHLAFLMILGLLLGLIKGLPIRTWEWLLLVIGLSQIEIVLAAPIVLWFIVLAWRKRNPPTAWERFDVLQLFIIVLSLLALGSLIGAVHTNLMVDIDMQVEGANSTNTALRWYVDQTSGPLPLASIISVPILVWRVTMLVWAFWLVWRLLGWVQWGWGCFSDGGFWIKPPSRPRPPRGPKGPPNAVAQSARVSESKGPVEAPSVQPAASAPPTSAPPAGAVATVKAPKPKPMASAKDLPKPKARAKATPEPKPDSDDNAAPVKGKVKKRRVTKPGESTTQKPGRVEHKTEPGTPRPERQDTKRGVPQVTRGDAASKAEETPMLFPPPDEDSEASDDSTD